MVWGARASYLYDKRLTFRPDPLLANTGCMRRTLYIHIVYVSGLRIRTFRLHLKTITTQQLNTSCRWRLTVRCQWGGGGGGGGGGDCGCKQAFLYSEVNEAHFQSVIPHARNIHVYLSWMPFVEIIRQFPPETNSRISVICATCNLLCTCTSDD